MRTQTSDPREVQALRERGEPVEIIDVRTPAEFAGMHVDGAKCIPLDQLNARNVIAACEANGQRPLYLICKSGQRASLAAERFGAACPTQAEQLECTILGGTRRGRFEPAARAIDALPGFRGEFRRQVMAHGSHAQRGCSERTAGLRRPVIQRAPVAVASLA